MAGTCCGMNYGDTQTKTLVDKTCKSANRMLGLRRLSFELPADSEVAPPQNGSMKKRRKVEAADLEIHNFEIEEKAPEIKSSELASQSETDLLGPKFGMTSVCGRRRDMEDAVAIHPSFCRRDCNFPGDLHFFGVFDGHGCSHVATRCKDRMHEIVKNELENGGDSSWEHMMSQSFMKMDKENTEWSSGGGASTSKCRCEMVTPQCNAVGSTAVVAVVSPDKIVVSNCGDSRAVLCRNGVAVPLSVDHKPDRPDELRRIEDSGGRVIFWDGPRVLAVLAMSRAIGDDYLKPYVIPEPEVTITDRTAEDECIILASDGLWDVVSNQTACGVARMCLQSRRSAAGAAERESSDRACSDAAMLLTRLALARRSSDNVSVVVVDLKRRQRKGIGGVIG
ncbi:hypothetical protein ACS0TY_000904 [Phlomoides rotata]